MVLEQLDIYMQKNGHPHLKIYTKTLSMVMYCDSINGKLQNLN